jgi:hypothetical protein
MIIPLLGRHSAAITMMRSASMRIAAALLLPWCLPLPVTRAAAEEQPAIRRSGVLAEVGALWFGNPEAEEAPTLFRKVGRGAFGATWPLLADEAMVGCNLDRPGHTVILVVAGQPWALNGQTSDWVSENMAKLTVAGEKHWIHSGRVPDNWRAPVPDLEGAYMSLTPLLEVARRMGCLAGQQKQGY